MMTLGGRDGYSHPEVLALLLKMEPGKLIFKKEQQEIKYMNLMCFVRYSSPYHSGKE